MSEKILNNSDVRKNLSKIQELSKIIYGNAEILDEKMKLIQEDHNLALNIAQQIKKSPTFISDLTGKTPLFIKDQTRKDAEQNITSLCYAIGDHASTLKHVENKITQEHLGTKCAKSILSQHLIKSAKTLFTTKRTTGNNLIFIAFSTIGTRCLSKALNNRLSVNEKQAIEQDNYMELANSIGTSIKNAKKIAQIMKLAKEAQKQAGISKIDRSKAMAVKY
ncbi:BID domain-containing T4SS effector [Bartonella ancashensis]|uniref:BID domain-containing T4SS effector n=1 Tax=Bartonella ancashensis TaxID=1318743 RepID=UPI00214F5AD3|nr:BID domain-containing T4SS effector [Bartonella ancashensis]